ncbi:MAG: crossover junction endodeoxyribonuclease RuvC [Armatimonadota bacterium]|nr:crossover junction endodeoxyribonuclease RuvC [Armatimonadota bacterium]
MTLGIDPGLRHCGIAVLGPEGLALTTWGAAGSWPAALGALTRRLARLLGRLAPQVVGIEAVEWHGPRRGALALAHVAGALAGVCAGRGIPVYWARPVAVKARARRLGRSAHEDDAAAIAVWVEGHARRIR